MSPRVVRVRIRSVHCDECTQMVKDVMRSVPGVQSAALDSATGELALRVDDGVSFDDAAAWLSDVGVRDTEEVAGA